MTTEQVIKDTYLQIVSKNPKKKVTVTELCKKAHINRGTFYLHYLDIDDLLSQIEKEVIEELSQYGPFEEFLKKTDNYSYLTELMKQFLFHTKETPTLRLLLTNPNSYISEGLFQHYHDTIIIRWLNAGIPPKEIEYAYTYVKTGSSRIISDWVNNNFDEDPNELAEMLGKMVFHFIHSLIPSDNSGAVT